MLTETEFHQPSDIESACELLDELPDAIVVAGGQSLGLLTKEGIITPEVLVDITRIDELSGIERADGELVIGATTTHRDIERSTVVAEEIPVLADAAAHIADVQIRNAGTIGGVAAFADPTAEYPLVFLALGATVVTRTVDGEREFPVREDFFQGYYMSALEPHELVKAVRVPIIGENEGAGYAKLAYRENDRAVVNAVSHVRLDNGACTEAHIAVGSITDRPVLVAEAADSLLGSDLTDEAIDEAAATAREEAPIDPDPSISVEYREALVEVLVTDTLRDARTEAME